MTELKSCPFCGDTDAVPEKIEPRISDGREVGWHIFCPDCEMFFGYDSDYGGTYKTAEDAIKAWNTRVGDEDETQN